jgi:HrpA-like RNA helicase
MMIYGALFGCIDPELTIAASMSARNLFVSPFDKRDEADAVRKQFATDGSDHLAILVAFTKWKEIRRLKGDRAAQSFIRDSFLSRQTLFQIEDLRKQFANLLVSIGFLPPTFTLSDSKGKKGDSNPDEQEQASSSNHNIADANADNMALVKAVLCAGLYPNIIVAPHSLVKPSTERGDKEAGEVPFQSLNKGDVYLHPCTIAFKQKRLDSRYCCYHDMVKTSKTYVRDCTTVSPFALVLFGGTLVVFQEKGVVAVDEWLKFRIDRKAATLVKHLRAQMESMLLRKIVSPEDDVTGSPTGQALIQSISTLLRRDTAEKAARTDGAEIVTPWRGGGDQRNNNRRGGGGRGRGRGGRGRGRGGRGGR